MERVCACAQAGSSLLAPAAAAPGPNGFEGVLQATSFTNQMLTSECEPNCYWTDQQVCVYHHRQFDWCNSLLQPGRPQGACRVECRNDHHVDRVRLFKLRPGRLGCESKPSCQSRVFCCARNCPGLQRGRIFLEENHKDAPWQADWDPRQTRINRLSLIPQPQVVRHLNGNCTDSVACFSLCR